MRKLGEILEADFGFTFELELPQVIESGEQDIRNPILPANAPTQPLADDPAETLHEEPSLRPVEAGQQRISDRDANLRPVGFDGSTEGEARGGRGPASASSAPHVSPSGLSRPTDWPGVFELGLTEPRG